MSKKKPRRSSREQRTGGRPGHSEEKTAVHGGPPRRSWGRVAATMLAATILSAVAFFELTSRTGMLGAMMRIEYLGLTQQLDSRIWGTVADADSTWQRFGARLGTILSDSAVSRRHDSVSSLMRALASDADKALDADGLREVCDRLLAVDRENLVSRLAVAVLQDRRKPMGEDKASAPPARFAEMRSIVEQDSPSLRAKLYRQEYERLWETALEPFIARADVRTALSVELPQVHVAGYNDQARGLVIIHRHLAALAGALSEAGLDLEAAVCRGWDAALTLGLLESEAHAPTQLLCVRILAAVLDEQPQASGRLAQLLADYYRHTDEAPRDLTDQSHYAALGTPALKPMTYETAFNRLVAGLGFVAAAVGCFAILILVAAGALLAKLTRRRPQSETVGDGVRWSLRLVVLLVASAIGVMFWVSRMQGGIYSGIWIYCSALQMVCIGIASTVLIAGMTQGGRRRGLRLAIGCGLVLLPILILAFPPYSVSAVCRRLDLSLGVAAAMVIFFGMLVTACLVNCPARLRTIAGAAVLGWCANVGVAVVVMQFHSAADGRLQDLAAVARRDEFAARLGEDWQAKYLPSAREAVGAASK